MPSKRQLDPSLIGDAPSELPSAIDDSADDFYFSMVSSLSSELEETRAELIRVKTKKTIDEVRAGMLEGYSNRVFWFVAVYCLVVGVLLVLAGFKDATTFVLSDTILGIIAGSTAVSVIGLIGMVISGLFGGVKTAPEK